MEERNKDNESIQEKSEKEKKISFTSIHPFSSLYHIIQNL
jgi:CRISPR/Cas system CSM-associated protein Csm4 (group 5 of RAMP superfamily)